MHKHKAKLHIINIHYIPNDIFNNSFYHRKHMFCQFRTTIVTFFYGFPLSLNKPKIKKVILFTRHCIFSNYRISKICNQFTAYIWRWFQHFCHHSWGTTSFTIFCLTGWFYHRLLSNKKRGSKCWISSWQILFSPREFNILETSIILFPCFFLFFFIIPKLTPSGLQKGPQMAIIDYA